MICVARKLLVVSGVRYGNLRRDNFVRAGWIIWAPGDRGYRVFVPYQHNRLVRASRPGDRFAGRGNVVDFPYARSLVV
jgi:hypothetical protein